MKLTGIGTSGTLNFVRDFLSLLPHISITQSSKFKEMKSHISHIQDQVMKPKGVPEKVGFRNFQNICNSWPFRSNLDLLGMWAILGHSGPFWATLGLLDHSGPVGPFWTILGILGHFQAFGPFKKIKKFNVTSEPLQCSVH